MIRHAPRELLAYLWVFAAFNHVLSALLPLQYAPILETLTASSIHEPAIFSSISITSAVIIEIPIAMIVATRYLPFAASKATNLVAAMFMALQQSMTLMLDTPTPHCVFFSVIEITTQLTIFSIAVQWKREECVSESTSIFNESSN